VDILGLLIMFIEPQNLSREMILPAYKAAVIYVPIIYVPIRHHLYTCKETSTNRTFYAKQTQFPKGQNEHKLFYNKGL
jgi:hypothetical protein